MIGKLAPRQYQGVMMGSWMLVTGLASLFAGDFSGMIPEPTGTTAIATNPGYAKLFAELGRWQPRGRYCARRADSVPTQTDHRQGRDASRRNGDCLPRRNVVEEGRSRRLNTPRYRDKLKSSSSSAPPATSNAGLDYWCSTHRERKDHITLSEK